MINKIAITGVHFAVDDDLKKYATNKIGKLDKYIPRKSRESAHAEIFLKETKAKDKKQCICEVVLHLPHGKIATKESTINMYAAIDIVETKLKNQIKKYKDTHGVNRLHRRVLSRLKQQS